jgi:hypothetical protein
MIDRLLIAVGGNIVSFYNGSLCVRDGLIVEDY